jgi:hypothetical protein
MFSGNVTAGIAVMDVPDVTGDMLLQNHDVASSNRRHAHRRGGARETTPIAGEIQLGNDPSKFEQRGLAPTKRMRASGRTTADDPFVSWDITDEQRHGVKMLMAIKMAVMGFGLNGKQQQARYRNNSFPHRGRTP